MLTSDQVYIEGVRNVDSHMQKSLLMRSYYILMGLYFTEIIKYKINVFSSRNIVVGGSSNPR